MKTTTPIALAALLCAGPALACAPEVQAVAVNSRPVPTDFKHKARTLRTLWHGGTYLASLEVLGPCAPAEPSEVTREIKGSQVSVDWKWAPDGLPPGAQKCLRQIDITFYGLPAARNYAVQFAPPEGTPPSCK